MKLSILLFLFFTLLNSSLGASKLCSGIVIHGDKLQLNDTEKRMVCGDKKVEAYKHIPALEASLFFKGFLQDRGYLNPKFKNKNDKLHVYTGKKSRVRMIDVYSGKRNLNKVTKRELNRLFHKRVLRTDLLNAMEKESLLIARERGYPCTKISSEVNTLNDTTTIVGEKLEFHRFGDFKREKVRGLRDNALERYYPFVAEDPFNDELLKLHEKRIYRSEVLPGTYFLENCSEDGKEFSLEQRFLDGPPRSIRFGAGASTEVGPMVRGRWNHNRYKSMASTISLTALASLRNQSLNFTSDAFFWKTEPRRSVLSQAELVRDSQLDYEQTIFRLLSQVKWTRDKQKHFQQYILGPVFETGKYTTIDEADTNTFANVLLAGDFSWTSHKYELFDIHPQEGDLFQVKVDLRHPNLGFTDPLAKFDSTAALVGRLANSGRGTIVGGTRVYLGTTFVNDEVTLGSLPPEVKFYGGGSDDVRGFLLQTLPKNDGLGALSKAELKLELRRTYVYRPSIEIFAFFDQAYFGEESFSLDPTLWYSPGIGLRWLSPFGLVQTYASRGYSNTPYKDYGWYYFVGIGGIF